MSSLGPLRKSLTQIIPLKQVRRVFLSHQLLPPSISSWLIYLTCFLLIFPGLPTSQRQRTHSTIQPYTHSHRRESFPCSACLSVFLSLRESFLTVCILLHDIGVTSSRGKISYIQNPIVVLKYNSVTECGAPLSCFVWQQ